MAQNYGDETKAAVMAALLAGQSVSSVARQYEIPKGTVSGWRKQAGKVAGGSEGVATVATQKKQEQIQGLLLDLVIAQLNSQIAMANHCTDKEWLMQQDASALGTVLGIENDKLFRLLGALENVGSESQPAAS